MRPILIQLGPLPIYSWGFMVAIGFIAGLFVATREAKRVGVAPEKIMDLSLFLLIAGLIFGRLVYILFDLKPFLKHPLQILVIQSGGLAIHGSILGGILVGYWFSRRNQISFGKLADIVAPALILGQAIGRLGCFLNGDSYGKITNLPWAVQFPGLLGARHPTQLYEAGLNFLVFLIIWRWRTKKEFDGHLFLVYLILYSTGRFFVEIFRESQYLYQPITYGQAASIAIILGSYLVVRYKVRSQKSEVKGQES